MRSTAYSLHSQEYRVWSQARVAAEPLRPAGWAVLDGVDVPACHLFPAHRLCILLLASLRALYLLSSF